MTSNIDEQEFRDGIGRLEGILADLERLADVQVQDKCREAVQALLEFHALGLERMIERLRGAGQPGAALLDEMAADDLVGTMLVLHNLHPQPLDARVEAALERVRPLLASHGGNVELLSISPQGEVHLKLLGSCHGCPSSQATLKNAIEEAIFALAADVAAIHVQGVVSEEAAPLPSGFVPLSQLAGQAG